MSLTKLSLTVLFFCGFFVNAQKTVRGLVFNEYLEPFYKAKITGPTSSTFSNLDGEFILKLRDGKMPKTITISADGFQTEETVINTLDKRVKIILKEKITLDEIVVSASRTPERIIESPVTIERLSLNNIKKTPQNSFYNALSNLKGVDVRQNGYTFNSVNTRGFSDYTNTRFVQLLDGMDTSLPSLNFSMGNVNGVSELDVQSVEVLPGASSALYGANAYNGLMLINTKSPFDYEGVSVLVKSGFTKQKEAGNNPFYETNVRLGHKFSNQFAAKINFGYTLAEEWHANDFRNRDVETTEIISGNSNTRFGYDGLNTYGDEVSYDDVYDRETGQFLRRTGYKESDILGEDQNSKNIKFSAAFHFRPFKDQTLEVILANRISLSDNLYHGQDRFFFKDFYFEQSKLEFKGKNFYVRGYYTRNDAGKSYNIAKAGQDINDNQFDPGRWFNDFDSVYRSTKNIQKARLFADRFRSKPGSVRFNKILAESTGNLFSENLSKVGSRIYDKTRYFNIEGNYNFSDLLNNWADIQIGGSYRKYNTDSQGTLFNDKELDISIVDYGIYSQIQKKLFDDRFKLTASLRYDKSTNYDGYFSPRAAITYEPSKASSIRLSYQTGFRNPSVQEQYANLASGIIPVIGSAKENLKTIFTADNRTLDLNNALISSILYGNNEDQSIRFPAVKSDYKEIKPEIIKTFELGYRNLISLNSDVNLNIDLNAFYNIHTDFITQQAITTPVFGKIFPYGTKPATEDQVSRTLNDLKNYIESPDSQVPPKFYKDAYEYAIPIILQKGVVIYDIEGFNSSWNNYMKSFLLNTNAKSEFNSYGGGIALQTSFRNFDIGFSYEFMDYSLNEDKDKGSFKVPFNTSKHKVKFNFGREKLIGDLGFNVNVRWRDKFLWISQFGTANVDPITVLDAQLNYNVKSIKSTFKLGGTNLFGKEYQVAPGTGNIGSLYYLSWTINN